MNSKRYFLAKQNGYGEIACIDYTKIDGYKVKPKEYLPYEGIAVNKMILIKPSLVEKVLKRKIKIKLDKYMQYVISLIDDEDDGEDNFIEALNELSRYKEMIRGTYAKFLDEKYIKLLLKKIALLEEEIKRKKIYNTFENIEEVRKKR